MPELPRSCNTRVLLQRQTAAHCLVVLQEYPTSGVDIPTSWRPDPTRPLIQAQSSMHDARAYTPQSLTSLTARAAAAHVAEVSAGVFDGAAGAAWRRRVLQVALGSGGRTVVTSAAELQEAVAEGVLYIEVRAHLDFTAVSPLADTEGKLLLRADAGRVNAIWVRPRCP